MRGCIALLIAASVAGAQSPERVWLAGRYDRDRVIVYFNAVRFGVEGNPFPKMREPIADAFFTPDEMPEGAEPPVRPGTWFERFSIGDTYDLILDRGRSIPVRLSTRIAFISDEQVGNDSYVGALATIRPADRAALKRNYFVLRPRARKTTPSRRTVARLDTTELSATLRPELIRLAKDAVARDKAFAGISRDSIATSLPRVQAFTLANGEQRLYVVADAGSCRALLTFARKPLRVLSVGEQTCLNGTSSPTILNVVGLDRGRTGLILDVPGGDGRDLRLVEYRDGVALLRLRAIQMLSVGE